MAAIGIVVIIAKKIKDVIWDMFNLTNNRVDIQNALFEQLEKSKGKRNENNRKS